MSRRYKRPGERRTPVLRGIHRCLYCGLPAGTRDHYLGWMRTRNSYVVPACRECNGLLGTHGHRTLGDRVLYIRERLRAREAHPARLAWADAVSAATAGLLLEDVFSARRSLRTLLRALGGLR